MAKIWITKYALTEGITTGEVLAIHQTKDRYTGAAVPRYLCRNDAGDQFYLGNNDFCDSLKAAVKKAKEMQDEEVRALEMKIRQLKDLNF